MRKITRMLELESRVAAGALFCAAVFGAYAVGCGDSESTDGDGTGGSSSGGSGGSSGASGTGGTIFPDGGFGDSGWQDGGEASVCAAQTATGELQPVYLAFAFDVSGSMGELDFPWHDPVLKWDPVVAATEAFFADPASVGITSSLTFFPALTDRCLSSMYTDPDVPMTPLPSNDFEAAITAITPQTQAEWRGGTPTLAVLQGTYEFLDGFAANANPDAIYAVVLVTDGYPQGCGEDDNQISTVVDAVEEHAATFPTYVIGVANPPIPNAPDTVSDLDALAVAGGTSEAFIIETGNPGSTKDSFSQAINEIRGQSVSCNITIPPAPAGQVFDRSKVTVLYTSGGEQTAFVYDPECVEDNAWYYDDPSNPKTIVLCPGTCDSVMSDPTATLLVEFGCDVVIDIK